MDNVDADPAHADAADAADALDADIWEALAEDIDTAIGPSQGHISSPPPPRSERRPSTPPTNPPTHDGGSTDSQAQLTVDHFTSGSPGAQIPGTFEDRLDPSHEDTSIWAPFHSLRDWNIALWAKTRGPTSTAVTELLQIPEV